MLLYLTRELAQPIVDRAMEHLQRNVNIMDARGYIVGSGDPHRIGGFHPGAAEVLRTGRRVEIRPEDVTPGGAARAGVNLPLRLGEKIVGVVGITGAPDEVRPFGELIREMVEMMLAQARSADVERTAALVREACWRELLTGEGPLPDRLLREAGLLGLNPDFAYRVLLCEPHKTPEPGNYLWVEAMTHIANSVPRTPAIEGLHAMGPWDGSLVFVIAADGNLRGYEAAIAKWLGPDTRVAMGLTAEGWVGLRRSYRSACLALAAGRRANRPGIFRADSMEVLLSTAAPEAVAAFSEHAWASVPPAGSEAGRVWRETIEAFAEAGMSMSGAADRLGVHRHTLTNRLEQIEDETGLDPRKWDGLLKLYIGLFLERHTGQNVQGKR